MIKNRSLRCHTVAKETSHIGYGMTPNVPVLDNLNCANRYSYLKFYKVPIIKYRIFSYSFRP